ncbi:unknown [Cryptophlebia leucotreta granulovirus]|uniref:Uncharacterized protein n=1 Tax=Cryptophlebia leucotreta granulosis virus TaxID=35254 RepID=Q7T5H3_GVCL|nr:hypothetical protein [Cryptophlebia leucotreta granulovirus]AAQ21715.1 unknown [Cryptophlebia leucotreta granulovirus]AUF82057.1 hypothetical protein [Cryptophlebia leucotreta granulovirus]
MLHVSNMLSVEQLQNVHVKCGPSNPVLQLTVSNGLLVYQTGGKELSWIELSGIKGDMKFVYENAIYEPVNGQIKIMFSDTPVTRVFGSLNKDDKIVAYIDIQVNGLKDFNISML